MTDARTDFGGADQDGEGVAGRDGEPFFPVPEGDLRAATMQGKFEELHRSIGAVVATLPLPVRLFLRMIGPVRAAASQEAAMTDTRTDFGALARARALACDVPDWTHVTWVAPSPDGTVGFGYDDDRELWVLPAIEEVAG